MTKQSVLKSFVFLVACVSSVIYLGSPSSATTTESAEVPRIVDAGPAGGPPSDAIVLFDGTALAEWRGRRGEAKWDVKDGVLTITPGTGQITTKRRFGDIQLHIEWRIPANARGGGESRGNSGIKFHEAYEIQILDSYQNRSRPTGQAGAVYKQHAPLVNVSRKPGSGRPTTSSFARPSSTIRGSCGSPGHSPSSTTESSSRIGPRSSDAPTPRCRSSRTTVSPSSSRITAPRSASVTSGCGSWSGKLRTGDKKRVTG